MNSGFYVAALIAAGMGAAFWLSDRSSGTSRMLALFMAALGVSVYANTEVMKFWLESGLPGWTRGVGLLDALVFVLGCEWGLRVADTVTGARPPRGGRWLMRAAQLLALVYAALVAMFPRLRYADLGQSLQEGRLPPVDFLFFVVPLVLASLLVLAAAIQLLRMRPDNAERVRIWAALVAAPMFMFSLILPWSIAPVAIAAGEIALLFGALRYHVIQGARGLFMARFLSPQVAAMVRDRGLRNAMSRKRVELSVISCDIRAFTRYAQAHSPEQVMRLLRAFYSAVGAATQAYGGTIKDLAGDGALILIGAPVAYPDHARRAVDLARQLQAQVRPVIKRYSADMGLGVGVASGTVAVGIVGEGARYEYMAVGPAVNLAARLCERAADGEIHIDTGSLEASGEPLPARKRRRYVKGLNQPVMTYVLETDD